MIYRSNHCNLLLILINNITPLPPWQPVGIARTENVTPATRKPFLRCSAASFSGMERPGATYKYNRFSMRNVKNFNKLKIKCLTSSYDDNASSVGFVPQYVTFWVMARRLILSPFSSVSKIGYLGWVKKHIFTLYLKENTISMNKQKFVNANLICADKIYGPNQLGIRQTPPSAIPVAAWLIFMDFISSMTKWNSLNWINLYTLVCVCIDQQMNMRSVCETALLLCLITEITITKKFNSFLYVG